VVPLYCDSDGCFPNHHPDPVKTANLADLRRTVRQRGADLGIAYDGDADRIGVVDELEQVIWGDKLMCLYWREILERHPGSLAIIEVKCSQALVDEVTRLGGRPLFYKTGHSLIKAKMRETGAVFTGEMSGHMFFADEYYGYDDAFYATGRLLRILSNTSQTLSESLAHIPVYYATAETRVPCADQVKFDIVGKLVEHFRRSFQVVDIDGARVLFSDGWGLVRASNTQPVLVARCEAKTPEGLEQICDTMKQAMLQYPEVGVFDWER
jgi:phosphomannomutase/phosphoglucomutase